MFSSFEPPLFAYTHASPFGSSSNANAPPFGFKHPSASLSLPSPRSSVFSLPTPTDHRADKYKALYESEREANAKLRAQVDQYIEKAVKYMELYQELQQQCIADKQTILQQETKLRECGRTIEQLNEQLLIVSMVHPTDND